MRGARTEQHAIRRRFYICRRGPGIDALAGDATSPELGFTTPAMRRSRVVLPEPLTPMIATTLPLWITMSIPVRTARWSYAKLTLVISMSDSEAKAGKRKKRVF